MREEEPLGWATDLLVALDELAPGLIRRVVVAAPMVRQAIFLTLAHCGDLLSHTGASALAERATSTAESLRSDRAKEIVRQQFGSVPEGFLGALERIGPKPLPTPHSYERLWSIFNGDARRAVALREGGEITARALRVIDTLDPLLIHPEVLKRVETTQQAHDLNRSVRFLMSVCSKANEEAISAALRRMRSVNALRRLLHRLVREADRFPPQPTRGDDELRPLATARAMIEAGRSYRNCLGSKIGEALMGRVAFAEITTSAGSAICEFRPLSAGHGWLLADVHIERNGIVPTEVLSAAQGKCDALGFPHVLVPEAGDWRSVRRMIGQTNPFAFAA